VAVDGDVREDAAVSKVTGPHEATKDTEKQRGALVGRLRRPTRRTEVFSVRLRCSVPPCDPVSSVPSVIYCS
jgi:hypothetical protein